VPKVQCDIYSVIDMNKGVRSQDPVWERFCEVDSNGTLEAL